VKKSKEVAMSNEVRLSKVATTSKSNDEQHFFSSDFSIPETALFWKGFADQGVPTLYVKEILFGLMYHIKYQ